MTIHTQALLAAAAAVSNGATVQSNVAPFSVGMTALASVTMNGFNGTAKIQSSEDGTTWADTETIVGAVSDRTEMIPVKLGSYVRAIVSAYTAGSVSVLLQG